MNDVGVLGVVEESSVGADVVKFVRLALVRDGDPMGDDDDVDVGEWTEVEVASVTGRRF